MRKVISGGQVGVDRVALIIAQRHGLETGGWMPSGWRSQDGPHPEFEHRFGMEEHPDPDYPGRTRANVAMADATLRIAFVLDSPGERCTLNAINDFRKPWADIVLFETGDTSSGVAAEIYLEPFWRPQAKNWRPNRREFSDLTRFLHSFRVVNVAGNTPRTHPLITPMAERILNKLFARLQALNHATGCRSPAQAVE